MRLELRFFANFRQTVGQKELQWDHEEDTVPVGEVLEALEAEYPDLELFDEEGEIRKSLSILKNGRDVEMLDGTETEMHDGDRLSLFPPVAGG